VKARLCYICRHCAADGGRFRWATTDGACRDHSQPGAPLLPPRVIIAATLPPAERRER
jgi:hypothetical protein